MVKISVLVTVSFVQKKKNGYVFPSYNLLFCIFLNMQKNLKRFNANSKAFMLKKCGKNFLLVYILTFSMSCKCYEKLAQHIF